MDYFSGFRYPLSAALATMSVRVSVTLVNHTKWFKISKSALHHALQRWL